MVSCLYCQTRRQDYFAPYESKPAASIVRTRPCGWVVFDGIGGPSLSCVSQWLFSPGGDGNNGTVRVCCGSNFANC